LPLARCNIGKCSVFQLPVLMCMSRNWIVILEFFFVNVTGRSKEYLMNLLLICNNARV
jgi:hypothetical protein